MEEKNENSVNILSDAGLLKAKRIDKNNISVNMGKISNEWNHIPFSEKLDTLNVSFVERNLMQIFVQLHNY